MVLPTSSKSSTVSASIHPKSAALMGATNLFSCTPLRSRPFMGAVVTTERYYNTNRIELADWLRGEG